MLTQNPKSPHSFSPTADFKTSKKNSAPQTNTGQPTYKSWPATKTTMSSDPFLKQLLVKEEVVKSNTMYLQIPYTYREINSQLAISVCTNHQAPLHLERLVVQRLIEFLLLRITMGISVLWFWTRLVTDLVFDSQQWVRAGERISWGLLRILRVGVLLRIKLRLRRDQDRNSK